MVCEEGSGATGAEVSIGMYVGVYVCIHADRPIYACMCVHVCMRVLMYACMCVFMYVCVYMNVCICVYMYVCLCVYMYVCICVYMYTHMHA